MAPYMEETTKESKMLTRADYKSFGHLLMDKLTRDHANVTIYIETSTGREVTGSQVAEMVRNVACALIDLHNFKAGDAICISYENSLANIVAATATVIAGGIVSCQHYNDPYDELLYLAQKVGPKFLFCHERNLLAWTTQLERDLGHPVTGFAMDSGDCERTFDQLVNYGSVESASLKLIPVACKDIAREIAFITCSSGSTGKPKAVPVTHKACLNEMEFFENRNPIGLRMASSLSLDYVSGRGIVMHAITEGFTAVIIDGFQVDNYLKAIERYKINVMYLGANSFFELITHQSLDQYDISSLMIVCPTGSKINFTKNLSTFYRAHKHICEVHQGYGSSEMYLTCLRRVTPENYLLDPQNNGKFPPCYETKVMDRNTGQLLTEPFQEGILHIRGPTITPGYYDMRLTPHFIRDPNAFSPDGFFITGDIVYFNEHNELYIVGRDKELIVCGDGKKMLPSEVEELVEQHPAVLNAGVIVATNPSKPNMQYPRAFVVLKPSFYNDSEMKAARPENYDANLSSGNPEKLCSLSKDRQRAIAEDLLAFVNQRIGWEKKLTGGVVILDEIPSLRRSGKIDKQSLASITLDQVEIYGNCCE